MDDLKLNRTVDPATPVVTDDEQKDNSKILLSDDDAIVTLLNTTATEYIEDRLEFGFVDQTWELSLNNFPAGDIELFRSPLSSVTSITYLDPDGNSQTLAADQYILDDKVQPPVITRAENVTWPNTQPIVNSVTVTFIVGYGTDADDTPEKYKMVIKQLFTHLYRNRDIVTDRKLHEVPFHIETLLAALELRVLG